MLTMVTAELPAPEWLARAAEAPIEFAIDDVYMSTCQAPARLRGFSFSDTEGELRQMREVGANAVGVGRMWVPVRDPAAPHGAGTRPFDESDGRGATLGQTFVANAPFIAVEVCSPTFSTEGSGATLSLYAIDGADRLAARTVFTDAADNSWLKLTFAPQPPGRYRVEMTDPTGDAIGLWAAPGDTCPDGTAVIGGRPSEGLDFELAATAENGKRTVLVESRPDHQAMRLGRGELEALDDLGMSANMMVGNWNNGGFPYYPKWFYEANPDMVEIDHRGQPIEAGMFGEAFGWPNIENATVVDGTTRQIRRYVDELRNARPIAMWTLGGEALYATYLYPERWTDYGPEALAHFRAWLARKYGGVGSLNEAWGSRYASFAEAEPPRPPGDDVPSLDFLDFRFSSMAERFAWHYQAVHEGDTSRLTVTCNHGDLYAGRSYAWMGARPDLYATVADGWETGQIMGDDDAKRFNLLYCEGLASFGKPVAPVRLAYKLTDPTARGGGRSYTPAAARRYFYECLGWGDWFVGFIQWRGSLPDGEWGVKGTPALGEMKRIFGEVAASERELLHTRPLRPRLGIYFSHPVWALRGFMPTWQEAHEALIRRHVPKVHLYDTQIAAGRLDGTQVILSIDNSIIADAALEGLRRFVADGGRLIILGRFAEADERLRPRAPADWITGPNVVRLVGPVDAALEGALRRVDRDVPVSPWRIDTRGATAEELRTAETTPTHDTPFDLAGHGSIGQTLRADGGRLAAVSASLPTYSHERGLGGATLQVQGDGPEGPVIGETVAPAGTIADNAWLTVTVPADAPTFETYHLRILPDAGLSPLNLGVWGTAGDSYAGGTRTVDGQPADGDLKVRVTTRAARPLDESIEAFILSDGLNVLQVFVNVSDTPVDADVSLDRRLVPDPSARYTVLSLPSREELGRVRGDAVRFPLRLAPRGSAMVYLRRNTPEPEGREAAAWAASVEPSTGYARYLCDTIRGLRDEGDWSKVAALGSCLARQLDLTILPAAEGDIAYDVRVTDLSGRPVEGAEVRADLVPTEAAFARLRDLGEGRYELRLSRGDLPVRYDYAEQRYAPFTGPLRIVFTARQGARRAQEIVDATL